MSSSAVEQFNKFDIVQQGFMTLSHPASTSTVTVTYDTGLLGESYVPIPYVIYNEQPAENQALPVLFFNTSGVMTMNLYAKINTSSELEVTLHTPNVASGFFGSDFDVEVRWYLLRQPGNYVIP